MRLGHKCYATFWRSVLQGVIQKIGHALLHLLVIELEDGKVGMDFYIETDFRATECIVPPAGNVGDAVAKIVLAQLQNELSALERRIIQEHRNQADEAIAAFFGLQQNLALAIIEL